MFLFRLIIPTRDLFACRPEAYHLAQFIIHSRRFGETTVVAYCEKRLVSLLVGSGESGQGSLRREIVRAEIDDSWKDVLANFANFVVSPVPRFASFINRPCAHARADTKREKVTRCVEQRTKLLELWKEGGEEMDRSGKNANEMRKAKEYGCTTSGEKGDALGVNRDRREPSVKL